MTAQKLPILNWKRAIINSGELHYFRVIYTHIDWSLGVNLLLIYFIVNQNGA